MKSPFLVLLISFVVLWLSARIGAEFRKQQHLEDDLRHDLDLIVGATLTLLGLIIGFTFSMAVSRYDQRITTRRPRLTRLERNTFEQTYCLTPSRPKCVHY